MHESHRDGATPGNRQAGDRGQMGKEERKEMTAKELIKNLERLIKSRNGRDYPIVVWNGFSLISPLPPTES